MEGMTRSRSLALPLVALLIASAARGDVTDAPAADTSYMDASIGGAAFVHAEAGKATDIDEPTRKMVQDLVKEAPAAVSLFAALKTGLVSSIEGKTCPKTVVHYISGKNAPVQFVKHAKNNGPCSVSLYFGHGIGNAKDGPDKDVLDEVKAELAGLPPATPTSGQIGFSSCWAKQYGQQVPAGHGTPYQWDNDKISEVKGLTADLEAKKDAIINSVLTLCELCNFDVKVHLYFGEMDSGPGKTNEYGFSTW